MASPVVALNDHEFLMQLKGTDLMKYSAVNKEWTLFLKLNEGSYDSMMIDRQLNRLYLCNYFGSMIVKDLSTGLTLQKALHKRNDGVEYGFVNANGTIHRIGGLNDQHVTWNKTRGIWNPPEVIPQFAGDYLDMVSLIYVKSKNIILMLGGHRQNEYDDDLGPIGMWRFDIATSTWTHIVNVEEDYTQTPAVLTSDEQNVIIVESDWIEILDIQNDNDYQVVGSMKLPNEFRNAFAYPVLTKHRETEVIALTSGWFRKLFNTKRYGHSTCSLDILKLIAQFVCDEMLHLPIWNNAGSAVDHLAFHLADILSSDDAETPTPIELPGPTLPIPNKRLPNTAEERFRWSPIKIMKTKQCVLCLCAGLKRNLKVSRGKAQFNKPEFVQ